MGQPEKVLYTAKTHTTGGRDGASRMTDGPLDVKLSSPGGAGNGTNSEQLFAAGWSACFLSALAAAAGQMKVACPPDRAIDAEVDLGTNDGGYCSGPASTLACRVRSPRSPSPWWTPRTRSAPIPRPPAATSTSRSTWSDGFRSTTRASREEPR